MLIKGKRGKQKNETPISCWNAVRRDDHRRVYVRVRNSRQQRLLAMGDLETRRWRMDLRHEKRPSWLEVDSGTDPRYAHRKTTCGTAVYRTAVQGEPF